MTSDPEEPLLDPVAIKEPLFDPAKESLLDFVSTQEQPLLDPIATKDPIIVCYYINN